MGSRLNLVFVHLYHRILNRYLSGRRFAYLQGGDSLSLLLQRIVRKIKG